MAEGARGVPVPTAKITDQHLGPMDSAISLLSNEAQKELAKLRREYAITFADKGGGKFAFQCREDDEQGLLKEVNASSTCKFSNKVQGTEQLAYTEAQCVHDVQGFLQGNSLYYPSRVSMDEGHPDYAPVLPHMYAFVKTHKEAWPARVIAASRAVSTTGLSQWVGRGLRAMLQGFENLWWEESTAHCTLCFAHAHRSMR